MAPQSNQYDFFQDPNTGELHAFPKGTDPSKMLAAINANKAPPTPTPYSPTAKTAFETVANIIPGGQAATGFLSPQQKSNLAGPSVDALNPLQWLKSFGDMAFVKGPAQTIQDASNASLQSGLSGASDIYKMLTGPGDQAANYGLSSAQHFAGMLPVVGPMINKAGDLIRQGKLTEGMGEGAAIPTMLGASEVASPLLRAIGRGVNLDQLPGGIAEMGLRRTPEMKAEFPNAGQIIAQNNIITRGGNKFIPGEQSVYNDINKGYQQKLQTSVNERPSVAGLLGPARYTETTTQTIPLSDTPPSFADTLTVSPQAAVPNFDQPPARQLFGTMREVKNKFPFGAQENPSVFEPITPKGKFPYGPTDIPTITWDQIPKENSPSIYAQPQFLGEGGITITPDSGLAGPGVLQRNIEVSPVARQGVWQGQGAFNRVGSQDLANAAYNRAYSEGGVASRGSEKSATDNFLQGRRQQFVQDNPAPFDAQQLDQLRQQRQTDAANSYGADQSVALNKLQAQAEAYAARQALGNLVPGALNDLSQIQGLLGVKQAMNRIQEPFTKTPTAFGFAAANSPLLMNTAAFGVKQLGNMASSPAALKLAIFGNQEDTFGKYGLGR